MPLPCELGAVVAWVSGAGAGPEPRGHRAGAAVVASRQPVFRLALQCPLACVVPEDGCSARAACSLDDFYAGAWVRPVFGSSDHKARLDLGRAGRYWRGHSEDTAGARGPVHPQSRARAAYGSCYTGPGLWESETSQRRPTCAGRSLRASAQEYRTLLRARALSAQRGALTPVWRRRSGIGCLDYALCTPDFIGGGCR